MGQVFFLALEVFRQASLQKYSVFTFIRLPSTVHGRHSNSIATYTTRSGTTITEKNTYHKKPHIVQCSRQIRNEHVQNTGQKRYLIQTARNHAFINDNSCHNLQGESKMLEQTSGVSSPRQNKKNGSNGYMFALTNFYRYSPITRRSQSFTFLSGGTMKDPWRIQLQLKIKRHLTNEFFMPVKPFATARGPLKGCDNP